MKILIWKGREGKGKRGIRSDFERQEREVAPHG
jgi:hypothetical protein